MLNLIKKYKGGGINMEKTNDMKLELCELIFILDRSGSMGGLEEETIKGYNSVVKNQIELSDNLKVTTVLFDNLVEKIYDGVDAKEAILDNKKYYVRGSTAMLDAIGTTIKEVDARNAKLPESKRPKIIVAITTDGYENASKEYTYPMIKELIEGKKKEGWEFLFLAANIDEKLVGSNLGISANMCCEYIPTALGIEDMARELSSRMYSMRMDIKSPEDLDWKQ